MAKTCGKRFLFVVLLVLVFSGCSSTSENTQSKEIEGVQQGGEVTVGYYADISSYDPSLATSGGDQTLLYFVYDTLINYSPDLKPIPGLAKSWEYTDNKTLVFTLQEDVTFHDGTALDAEAVKHHVEYMNREESVVPDLQNVESVEVIDPLTVAFHFKKPDSSVLLALSDRAGMVVSPAAVAKHKEEYAAHPVGTGPFKLVDRIPNNEINLERYEDYWQENLPHLDNVKVKIMTDENSMVNALKSDEVQVIGGVTPTSIQTLEESEQLKLHADSSSIFQYMWLVTSKPPLNKKEVRLAISHAINRDELAKILTFGTGEAAYTPFPEGHWAHDPNLEIAYDPEKAKQLLKDANVGEVNLDIVLKPDAYSNRIGEAIKGQLEDVGINVNLLPTEVTKMTSEFYVQKKYHSMLARWTGAPDTGLNLRLMFGKDSLQNVGDYVNQDFESIITSIFETTDLEDQGKLISEASQIIILDDAVGIPLFYEPSIVAMNKKLSGYEPNQLGKQRLQFLHY